MFCASFSNLLHPLESQKLPSKNKQCQHAASPRQLSFQAAPQKSNKKLLESDLIFERKPQVKHIEQRFLCNESHTGNTGLPHTAQELNGPGWPRHSSQGALGFSPLCSLGGSSTSTCPAPRAGSTGKSGVQVALLRSAGRGGSLETPSAEALGRSSLWLPGASRGLFLHVTLQHTQEKSKKFPFS